MGHGRYSESVTSSGQPGIETTADAFALLFDDEVIYIIFACTNAYATEKLGEISEPTKYTEIRAYIELHIVAGIRKNGITDYTEFWDPLYGNLFFSDMYVHFFERLSNSCESKSFLRPGVHEILNIYWW